MKQSTWLQIAHIILTAPAAEMTFSNMLANALLLLAITMSEIGR